MGLDDVEDRFKHLLAEAGTVAAAVKAVLLKATNDINDLVRENHPALLSITQKLEQAAHVAVSSPAFRVPVPTGAQEATDPTSAGTPEPAAVDTSTSGNSASSDTSSSPTSEG